jgi:hypothetical protein
LDWIERLFHVSPDGGSGLLEWALVAAAVIVGLLIRTKLRCRSRRAEPLPRRTGQVGAGTDDGPSKDEFLRSGRHDGLPPLDAEVSRADRSRPLAGKGAARGVGLGEGKSDQP